MPGWWLSTFRASYCWWTCVPFDAKIDIPSFHPFLYIHIALIYHVKSRIKSLQILLYITLSYIHVSVKGSLLLSISLSMGSFGMGSFRMNCWVVVKVWTKTRALEKSMTKSEWHLWYSFAWPNFPLYTFLSHMTSNTANDRVAQIAAHLEAVGPSLKDKVCIVTGAGSLYGIG